MRIRHFSLFFKSIFCVITRNRTGKAKNKIFLFSLEKTQQKNHRTNKKYENTSHIILYFLTFYPMEKENFIFQIGDFCPKMDLLIESWDYHFFYFLARYAFEIEYHTAAFEFFLDDFIIAAEMSDLNVSDKLLNTALQNGCVQENPYLDFCIHPAHNRPVIFLKPLDIKTSPIHLEKEVIQLLSNREDFIFVCKTVQACE